MTSDATNECEPRSEDLRLASVFIGDAQKRADVLALYALLETLQDIPGRVSEPMLGEIRMRWWYEAVEEIRDRRTPRYHPLSEALQRIVGQYALPAEDLLTLIEGQLPLLDAGPLDMRAALVIVDKGEGMAAKLAARILDPSADASALADPARFAGMARLKRAGRVPEAGEAEAAHLYRDAAKAAKTLPASLMPLALPAALAGDTWTGRARGPLSKRLKLFWAFVAGNI
ncbi:squalene/phytoene synthase family protein [Asticcacaulis solisilvae]|uniref:squalene/phytoene synthase family protein n=1 Tax=Asticcacaulis solisilvae TaxID=1217274 RepID=UPI003FD82BBF